MKKVVFIVVCIITFIFTNFNVLAKDTVYSLNKYEEEKIDFIIDSYNEEGKKDGLIAAGDISLGTIESQKEYNHTQIVLIKYNYSGEIIWQITYGKECTNNLDYLEYTYDENGAVDGYLIVMPKTYDISEATEDNTGQASFVKYDLNGNIEWEKTSSTEEIITINKIIPTHTVDNKVDGYIAIATVADEETAMLIKYDLTLSVIWSKKVNKESFKNIKYLDLESVYENNNLIGYSLIKESINNDDSKKVELIELNADGNDEKIVNPNLDKYLTTNLAKTNNGTMLYGITDEVKLKKGDTSYYIIKYNLGLEEEWETIGEESVKKDSKLIIKSIINDKNEIEKYIIMYNSNESDNISTDVVEINLEGLFVKKIKKIASSYYTIESFNINNNILYFGGQINCPADDDCQYNKSSLFLISDEDKVIEVKDNTSRNILLITTGFIVLIVLCVYIKRKKSNT